MRYAYVKNGNAVDQVRRLRSGVTIDGSGPDAFIGDFISAHPTDDLLVLCRGSKRELFVDGRIRAESFPANGQRIAGIVSRICSAFGIGIEILRWRPERILCGCTGEILWTCAIVSKLLGSRLVHSRHNEIQQPIGAMRILSALDRWSIASCAGVICHGPFLYDQIVKLGVDPKLVHEFEVDLSSFTAAAEREAAPREVVNFAHRFKSIVMFVGRIQIDKGVLDLLEAFCGLQNDRAKDFGLVFLGDGKDMGLLRARLQQLNAQDRVLVTGKVQHRHLSAAMSVANVVVTPTRPEFPEGRCMVVLESMTLGIPVIGPDSGPFPYAIKHQVNGLLFKAGQIDDLRDAISRLVDDADLIIRLRRGAAESGGRLVMTRQRFAVAADLAFRYSNEICG